MARFEQGYQEIASIGAVPGRDNPKADTIQLVYEWLRDERNGAWLMVLDNVDDEHFFNLDHPRGKRPLVNFLPQVSHGSILLTSRNRLAARNLVGEHGHVITIDVMNEEESVNLLRTRSQSSQSPTEDEKTLVKELEFIPLAITQAGSYIANRSPRITVSKYLQLFNESETNRTHLLNHVDAKDLRRDPSIRHSIITTWQLSFEQIRRDQPPAADLLSLMSMFDRQGIPEDLARENQDTLQFEDMLAPLISFSLIREQTDKRSFDMHRLVQLSVRRWLEIHQQLDSWREKSREAMAQLFPTGDYEYWTTCLNLLPHSKEVLKFIPLNDQDRLNAATIASKSGYYLFHRGAYEEANVMCQQALEAREKVLGCDHRDTFTTVSDLGCVFQRQGNYKEAEAMHRRALEGREKLLGHNHPDTLTSIGNLGSVLEGQGKYKEAEVMHRRALEGQEKVLGRDHQDSLTSVSNLGCVFQRQGNYKEAEAMHRRALEGREKLLGHNHPDTLTSVGNLGSALDGQGKYEEAEAMYRRDLMGSEKVLGHEHPDTLASINNLGCVLQRQRKYKEVEVMCRRSLGVYEKGLGYEHPDTLTTVSNIGFVLQRQGDYEEAEAMYRRALAGREKVLGHEHPDTFASASRLGSVLQSQEKYKEAEAMHRRALAGRKKVLGHEHPSTLASASRLGFLLERQGKNKDARALRHADFASASMPVFNLSGMHIGNADQP
ncbi:hypothetical protein ATETN484_0017002200 [Aspergillus terreus]|nr:hypothetical protein ATETN484_0017002200 [Aspergillus terreus]